MNTSALTSWLPALRIYAHPRVLGMLSLGFSAGLPLLLVLGTLSFWLREAGIDRTTIGHLSWVGLACMVIINTIRHRNCANRHGQQRPRC